MWNKSNTRSIKILYSENWGLIWIFGFAALRLLIFNISRQKTILPKITAPFFIQWRQNFSSISHKVDGNGIITAMFLGDSHYLDTHTENLFLRTGLSHLLVASGYNCWISGFCFCISARIIRLLFPDSKFEAQLRKEYIFHFTGALLFWLWSDQSAPITRAFVFISLKTIFCFLEIKTATSRLLLIQYLFSLIICPQLFKSASFQLSFAAIAGLSIASDINKYLPRKLHLRFLIEYFLTNGSVLLCTVPVTWIFFAEINFTALVLNWLFSPLVSLFIMPFGILSMLLTPWATPGIVKIILWLPGIVSHGFIYVLQCYVDSGPILRYAPYRDF